MSRRNRFLYALALIILLLGLGWFLYWLLYGRFYVFTDDAYVHGNQVMLTPQVASGVKAIYADETDLVEKGQLVVELEDNDLELVMEEAKNRLGETVRDVTGLFENVKEQEAMIAVRRAQLIQTQLDLSYRIGLSDTGAISVQEYEQAQTDVEVAQANLALSEVQYAAALKRVEGTTIRTHPQVLDAVYALKEAYLNLIRCQIWAPVTGYVAKRGVQVGDQVSPGEILLMIVPLDYLWVEANYKETRLRHVRIGQPVEYTADLYGDSVTYHGRVIGLQAGTGDAFALLPAQNASGNWIKIIQRVPVRISIDPDALKEHPLLLGLSMQVTVDVHDTDGKMLSPVPTETPIYTTEIYREQRRKLEALDPLIEDIISTNAGPDPEKALEEKRPAENNESISEGSPF